MKTINFFPLLVLICLPYVALTQDYEMKWGNIPKEHLKMKIYEKDSAATALILGDIGTLNFDLASGKPRVILERHKRIKILKRSGFSYADISIPYYAKDRYEGIMKINATIFSPDGKKTKLKSKAFFTEALNENWEQIKFSFPNVQEGSVIEYEYKFYSEDLFQLPEWFFVHDIPVLWSEYNIYLPQWYDYLVLGNEEFDISDKEWTTKSYVVRSDRGTSAGQSGVANAVNVMHARYIVKDAPAFKEEAFITTLDDYRTRVRFQLNATNFDVRRPVMGTWPKTAEELEEAGYFGEQYLKRGSYRKIFDELEPYLEGVTSPAEKVALIYNFVNNQMEWDGYYGRGTGEKGIKDCFEKKKGNSTEINLMLVALLREAGIKAYPALTSTRTNGKLMPIYPILEQFNHTLVVVELGTNSFFLDAGNPMRPMGMIREASLNGQAWIVNGAQSSWVPIKPIESEIIYLAGFSIDAEGVLSGSFEEMRKGYSAVDSRVSMHRKDYKEVIKGNYKEMFPDAVVSEVKVAALEQTEKPLKVSTTLKIPEAVMRAGEFIYFTPIMVRLFDENPFKIKERYYPVDMPYPIKERFIMNLEIPDGYEIEELPKAIKASLPDNGGFFQFTARQVQGNVQVSSSVQLNQLRYEPVEYGALRHFIDVILEKQSEQIVLRRESE